VRALPPAGAVLRAGGDPLPRDAAVGSVCHLRQTGTTRAPARRRVPALRASCLTVLKPLLREEPYRGRVGQRHHETLAAGGPAQQGRFDRELRRTGPAPAGPRVQLPAAAPGHGLAWAAVPSAGGPRELAVVLRREREARGRLIDLQGQPVQGAGLHVFRLATTGTGGFAPPGYGFHDLPQGLTAWPASLTTDA